MEEYNWTESHAMDASSENSQYKLRESMANGFLSTDTPHNKSEIYEPTDVSVSMLRGVELANFADKFSNVETSKCNTGYAIIFAFSVIAFVVVTTTNFISDPTLFFSAYSDDLEAGKLKYFSFPLLIVFLYVPSISGIILLFFGFRKYLPKIVSIAFRIASYGLILFASFGLLLSNPTAFLLLIAGIACIWLRKWLASSVDIIQNFLHDFVVIYESFPKFTILVFFGFLVLYFFIKVFSKIIDLTHLHYEIEYFGAHDFSIEANDKSSASPMKLLILFSLHLSSKFIDNVTCNILIAAFISAYCLVQYQKDAPSGTPSYKDINFFKLFYTKSFGSMCCTAVLPILTQCFQLIFHRVIPDYGSTFKIILSIFGFLFDTAMTFLETSAFLYMILNEAGYFQSLMHIIKICRQKRWYIFKNFLLRVFSLFIFLVPIATGDFLLVSGCGMLFSFIFKTDYTSPKESEFFHGISGAVLEMAIVLAICRFMLPILMSERLEIISQNKIINLQNIQLSAEESSKKV